ncbi:hypothetical protein C0J52_13569 [Blattella germanica]|nr:hypothetical protein C0J52_13569 [Blattella germanica]
MPPASIIAILILTLAWSVAVFSNPEETNSTNASAVDEVKHRVTRSDVRAALGEKLDPGFWPSRGRRSNSEEVAPPFWANRGRSLKLSDQEMSVLEELMKFWKDGYANVESQRLRREEPLYADEPHWLLLGRRDEPEDVYMENRGESILNQNDPFWVARGRRRYEAPFQTKTATGEVDSSWASGNRRSLKRGLQELISSEEPFWAARGKRSQSAEEPFWAARGKKGSPRMVEDYRNRRGLLNSAEEPFWAARGKKSNSGRRFLESLSSEEPFWAARGRRTARLEALSSEEPFWAARGKKGLLESLSAEEPFWAARGRRGLLESLSAEEPFWAARGKKNSQPTEDTLSQMRTRETGTNIDPWWPVRGKRVVEEEANPEDERFWRVLESRAQNNSRTS